MAKSTNGGRTKETTKNPTAETKARRAPARRKAAKQSADAPVAVASDATRSELAAASEPAAPGAATPSMEEIARRAYELYVSRGCTDGSDVEDWLEAERQLVNDRTH